MTVVDNLQKIKQRITAACERVDRDPDSVQIIAVTKYVSDKRAKEALEAGLIHIGENRAEEGLRKKQVLNGQGIWHFIGTLQSRKVKEIVDDFDYIHSLDRLSLAKELQKRTNRKLKCFVQVNVAKEDSKHGIDPSKLIDFINDLKSYPLIEVIGLMTMAPYVDDPQETRQYFKALKKLQKHVQALELPSAPCQELSMGMSNDFEVAIEEGATFIRVGSSLVGKEM